MKIPITLQVVLLTVGMTAFYGMVGQSVPQKEVHPPEVIEIAEDISADEIVEIGKGIFEGKGICNTCHTIGKSGALRFPDLAGIAVTSASRKPGLGALDYLAESMYEPNIFIVDGYNPGMPAINKPPIGLTDQEIIAVIAYLQTLGGEVTVDMQTKFVYTGGTLEGGEVALADTAGDAGAEPGADSPLVALGCAQCHDAASPVDPPSPSLIGIGGRMSSDQLYLALGKHPSAGGVGDLTLGELQALVEHLTEQEGQV